VDRLPLSPAVIEYSQPPSCPTRSAVSSSRRLTHVWSCALFELIKNYSLRTSLLSYSHKSGVILTFILYKGHFDL